MQKYTSKATSINRDKLPAVYGKVSFRGSFVLDYGCGKYTAHISKHLAGRAVYLPYDPYNQPAEVNNMTRLFLKTAKETGLGVDVVCSNVLNVIDDTATVQKIAEEIEDIVTATAGTGYVTVYEGNRSGKGKQTGPDQYQRNEPLREYLKYFRNAHIKNGVIIVGQV